MLEPIKHILKAKKIILASGSPRRKEIFEKNIGLPVNIIPSGFAEDLDKTNYEAPTDYVKENSRLKALYVAEQNKEKDWFLIIGADTVVEKDNVIYEKPLDKEDAFNTLKKLSNSSHFVSTGVTLLMKKNNSPEFSVHSFHESTEVHLAELSDEVIRAYVETEESLDKSGSYGIQALGSTLVKSIIGDYFNIMGFPAHKFSVELKKFLEKNNQS